MSLPLERIGMFSQSTLKLLRCINQSVPKAWLFCKSFTKSFKVFPMLNFQIFNFCIVRAFGETLLIKNIFSLSLRSIDNVEYFFRHRKAFSIQNGCHHTTMLLYSPNPKPGMQMKSPEIVSISFPCWYFMMNIYDGNSPCKFSNQLWRTSLSMVLQRGNVNKNVNGHISRISTDKSNERWNVFFFERSFEILQQNEWDMWELSQPTARMSKWNVKFGTRHMLFSTIVDFLYFPAYLLGPCLCCLCLSFRLKLRDFVSSFRYSSKQPHKTGNVVLTWARSHGCSNNVWDMRLNSAWCPNDVADILQITFEITAAVIHIHGIIEIPQERIGNLLSCSRLKTQEWV